MDIGFIFITWLDIAYGLVHVPIYSGYLLLFILFSLILISLIYGSKTWCNKICFLGGFVHNYNHVSLKNNNYSNLIYKNLQLQDVLLAKLLLGIIMFQNLYMTDKFKLFINTTASKYAISEVVVTTIMYVSLLSLPFVVSFIFAKISSKISLNSSKDLFIYFSVSVIPIDLAANIGHNLYHIWTERPVFQLSTLGYRMEQIDIIKSVETMGAINSIEIFILYALTLIGFLFGLKLAYRMSVNRFKRSDFTCQVIYLLIIFVSYIYIYNLGMASKI